MLKYDLAELLRTPGMRQVYEIYEQPYTDDDVEYVAPIVGKVSVTNTGSMVLVRGPIDTVIELECSRCLEPVRATIHADLEEEFDLEIVESAAHRDPKISVVEEEIGRVFDGQTLRLDVLIRQAALLAAPLQPLCRENCPGIPIQEPLDPEAEVAENSPFRELGKLLQE
ncbi:MAG: YceD family protein [Janthinobacterium lividum]